jgi:hypothetical protein
MNKINRLSYKAGRLSTKLPKLSLKPIKDVFKAFKAGRDDSKTTTIIVD